LGSSCRLQCHSCQSKTFLSWERKPHHRLQERL